MSPFADWLDRVLTDGAAVLAGPPDARPDDGAAVAVLARAYAAHALDVAGPPLPFDAATATAAAHALADACWRLVSAEAVATARLPEPATPAAHLSADLTLRLLPAVLHRARLRGDGPLVDDLAALLRRWPLSGVLADLG